MEDSNQGNNEDGEEAKKAHQEAILFVERHKDLFEHYARGRVKIEPAPEGLNTFAFDLEKNTIYVNDRFYKKEGSGEERTTFGVCHELEHLLEKIGMLAEKRGAETFAHYLRKIKESRAFSLLDNCVADNKINRAVVSRTNENFRELEVKLYKEDLFPSANLSIYKDEAGNEKPVLKHIQFAQAILREHRLSDEVCEVDSEVREKLNELYAIKNKAGERLIDIMTHPDVPMSSRLRLQDQYILPLMKDLLEQDKEERKNKKAGKREGAGTDSGGDDADKGEVDPNEEFGDDYKEAEKVVPNAIPIEGIEKAFKKWQEVQGESPEAKADKAYAENIGVKKEDLQKYRQIVKELEKNINAETNESLIDELESMIRRIIAKRLKPAAVPKYPVEEGEDLVDPAQLIADVHAGNLEPKVWESIEIKEKLGKRFGEVEITLICDRSDSMNRPITKRIEQQKAAVFMMEALKRFADVCDEERINLTKPLEVRSEVFAFSQSDEDDKPLKKFGKELGEKERIEVMVKISTAPGGTTDFIPLETIDKNVSEEDLKKIVEGELKKIVIVFTDGESNDAQRVKNVLERLRGKGMIVVCITIGDEGKAAFDTYAPDVRVAEKAEKICPVLKDVLKEHLASL